MENRLEKSAAAAAEAASKGAKMNEIIAAAREVLLKEGGFGKKLDSDVRRAVKKATGVQLEPGAGHGTERKDGSIDYRNKGMKMEKGKVMLDGNQIDFDAAVNLMDDEIRERLHQELAPCSEQDFLDAYVEAHAEAFGEEFQVN